MTLSMSMSACCLMGRDVTNALLTESPGARTLLLNKTVSNHEVNETKNVSSS